MAFIAFEGLDGSGKSTLIKGLSQRLKDQKIEFILTREPGGTPLGDEIRELLLRTSGDTPVSRTELLLYQASRAQLVEKVIKPALAKKQWVLCDRYSASSIAFQAAGRGLDESQVRWLNEYATDHCLPDLWVLLDLTVEESLKRMNQRPQEKDRFEQEEQAFHQRVRDSFLKLAQEEPSKWLVLDAALKPEELLSRFIQKLKELKWLD